MSDHDYIHMVKYIPRAADLHKKPYPLPKLHYPGTTVQHIQAANYGGIGAGISFFYIKYYLSILSSSWAMAKFLQLGPCKLLPRKNISFGILLVAFTNFIGLSWKLLMVETFVLQYTLDGSYFHGQTHHFFELLLLECSIFVLPAILLVRKCV